MARRRRSGSGSVYRRASDGRWVAAVPVPEGLSKRRRLYLYADTAAEVEDKMLAVQRRMRAGIVPNADRITVGRFLDDWLDGMRINVRPSTWYSYEGHVRIHLESIRHIGLTRLQPADIRRLMARLIGEDLSPATARGALTVLRMALKVAIADGLLERNVALLVTAPRAPRHEIVPMTLEQAQSFLAAARGDRLEALYSLVIAVGLREGEALGLRWTHVDLDKGEIRIAAAIRAIGKSFRAEGERRLQLVEPKTASGRRVIPIPPFAVSALREHRRRQLEEQLAAGRRWKGNKLGLVFTTPVGSPLDPRNVNRGYLAMLAKAGLPHFRFHDLRHTAATMMLASGLQMKTIAEILGHRTAGMSELYAHVLPSMKADVAAVMEQLLGAREGTR